MLSQVSMHAEAPQVAGLQYTSSNRRVQTRQGRLDLNVGSMTLRQDLKNSDTVHTITYSN